MIVFYFAFCFQTSKIFFFPSSKFHQEDNACEIVENKNEYNIIKNSRYISRIHCFIFLFYEIKKLKF